MGPANRVAKTRAKSEAAGLRRVEVWAKPEHHDRIKNYAKKLRAKCNTRNS